MRVQAQLVVRAAAFARGESPMYTRRSFVSEFFSRAILLTALSLVLSSNTCKSRGDDSATAHVVWRGLSTPCGEQILPATLQPINPRYTFTGYEKDDALSLLDAKARMFSSTTCRFMAPDPIDHPTMSSYAYAVNNPLKYVDPDGRQEKTAASRGFRDYQIWEGRSLKIYNPFVLDETDYPQHWEFLTDAAWYLPAAAGNVGIMTYYAVTEHPEEGLGLILAMYTGYKSFQYMQSRSSRFRGRPTTPQTSNGATPSPTSQARYTMTPQSLKTQVLDNTKEQVSDNIYFSNDNGLFYIHVRTKALGNIQQNWKTVHDFHDETQALLKKELGVDFDVVRLHSFNYNDFSFQLLDYLREVPYERYQGALQQVVQNIEKLIGKK